MGSRVQIRPEILRWARERSGQTMDQLGKAFPAYGLWEAGERAPTLKQLESLANRTRTPLGYFFLEEPPEDKLSIPDFRTRRDEAVKRPSPDLLETIETMQRRQDWLRDFLIEEGSDPLPFVGSATLSDDPLSVALEMRKTLGFADGWASEKSTWTHALQHIREHIEGIGMLVVINGVVGNNNSRKLAVDEFRGFALSDRYAPLIFINGSDGKAAQMFTLAHELAHIWLGADGVSNFEALQPAAVETERFCNAAAAEFLVPAREVEAIWSTARIREDPYQYLARRFKVSPLVAARRVLDLRFISKKEFFHFFDRYEADERRKQERRISGGDFWNTQNTRVGLRFGTAVARAAREGKLLYRDAYRLTGLYGSTFNRFSERLGIRP